MTSDNQPGKLWSRLRYLQCSTKLSYDLTCYSDYFAFIYLNISISYHVKVPLGRAGVTWLHPNVKENQQQSANNDLNSYFISIMSHLHRTA